MKSVIFFIQSTSIYCSLLLTSLLYLIFVCTSNKISATSLEIINARSYALSTLNEIAKQLTLLVSYKYAINTFLYSIQFYYLDSSPFADCHFFM